MLTITIPGDEFFDEETEEFLTFGDLVLELEHSLVSLSKWESKFKKPYLGPDPKSDEEALGYIYAMMLTPNVVPEVVHRLSAENIREISEYIEAPMTATWFSEVTPETKKSGEIITNELIYYWMDAFGINIECQHWHLNRLFTLIKVHNAKSQKPKKMTRSEMLQRQRELNARRKAQLGTSG